MAIEAIYKRRERDSNPRYPREYSSFQDYRLKPLGHLSNIYMVKIA